MSLHRMSARKGPTAFSCASSSRSMLSASPNTVRFSSRASHGVKSLDSLIQIFRRSTRVSRPRTCLEAVISYKPSRHRDLAADHGPVDCRQYRRAAGRSEEHTSELQSRGHLVCRLLLEKKNIYRFVEKFLVILCVSVGLRTKRERCNIT